MQVTVKVTNQLQLQLHFGLDKLQVYYSSIVTVFEKVTVTVSVRDYKVAYDSALTRVNLDLVIGFGPSLDLGTLT